MIKFKNIYQIVIFACVLFLCSATNHNNGKEKMYVGEFVALDGHGDVKAGPIPGTLIKKIDPNDLNEKKRYLEIVKDPHLVPYVAKLIHGEHGYGIHIDKYGVEYLWFEDLSSHRFVNKPSYMECKLGVRTYLENVALETEVRPDLYKKYHDIVKAHPDLIKKMKAIVNNKKERDVTADDLDHRIIDGKKGLTKEQSMKWRDMISTTSKVGIRILAYILSDASEKVKFDVTLGEDDAMAAFRTFVRAVDLSIIEKYIRSLQQFLKDLLASPFYNTHEFIGTSVYIGHDHKNVFVGMFDFGKTVPLNGVSITHNLPWVMGNHEDGHLIGVHTLIDIFQRLKAERQ